MPAMSSQEKPQTDWSSEYRREESNKLLHLLKFTTGEESKIVSLEMTGLTFGFVSSVISPNGRAGAIDWIVQGHDIS